MPIKSTQQLFRCPSDTAAEIVKEGVIEVKYLQGGKQTGLGVVTRQEKPSFNLRNHAFLLIRSARSAQCLQGWDFREGWSNPAVLLQLPCSTQNLPLPTFTD